MSTLDTNIFARTLDVGQPEYGTCHALLHELRRCGTPTIVPRIVFAEIAAAVHQETRDAMRARLFVELRRAEPTLQAVPIDEGVRVAMEQRIPLIKSVYTLFCFVLHRVTQTPKARTHTCYETFYSTHAAHKTIVFRMVMPRTYIHAFD